MHTILRPGEQVDVVAGREGFEGVFVKRILNLMLF